ncbi:MAG: hypothetical protein ACFFDB_00230 [Promethearchaeota archaeon]
MSFANFKKNISENKKVAIGVSLSGTSACFFLIFAPFIAISLVMGVLCFGVAYDYRKRKEKGKRRMLVLGLLILIGTIYIGTFLALTTRTRESMTVNEDGTMEYTQEGNLFGGESWYFDTDFRDENGQIDPKGELRFPIKPQTAIYHKLSSSQREDNDEYTFHIKTNIRFKNYEIECTVYGSDEKSLLDAHKIRDFDIEVDKSEWWTGGDITWRYDSLDNITTDGDDDYEYYMFVFKGDVNENQDLDFTLVWTWISIEADESGGEWGFTEVEDESLSDIMAFILDAASPLYILIVMSIVIIMVFTIAFLLFLGTASMQHMDKILTIMTMTGILLLLYLIAWSENLFIIKDILNIINIMPDFFGIWEAIKIFVRIVGMIVAFYLWSWTVGNAIMLCWGMYYIWNRFIGGFLDDVMEE